MKMPKIAQLLRDNAARPRSLKVEVKDDEATVYLYDVIGFDFWTGEGVTAKRFAEEIGKLTAKTIHLRINSPGGDVFEARAMVAAMQRHPAKFEAHVDGLAASAASFIAVRADALNMTPGSMLMVHNAWTMAVGDHRAMAEAGDLLKKVDGTIADDYQKKSGKPRDEVVAWMDAETWFTAEEALGSGLADAITGEKVKAQAWNLGAYENAPAPSEAPEPEPAYGDHHMKNLERRLALLERAPA